MTTAPATKKHGYSSFQISVHWTVAALVLTNWLLGGGMEQTFEARQDGETVTQLGPAYAHIAVGVSVLLVMVARLAAKLSRPVEVAPDSPHRFMALLGKLNHWAFYGILFLIPVLGAIAWFGRSEAAGRLHSLAVQGLVILLALHVAGVIVHQLLGDGIIRRMARPTGGT